MTLMTLADYSKAFDTANFRSVITKMHSMGFSKNVKIKDRAYLDPRRFDEIVLSGVPENSLTKVAKITGVDPLSLKEELCCFARNFTVLSRSLPDESEGASDDAVTMTVKESSEEESNDNEDVDGGVGANPILRNRNAACKGNCKKVSCMLSQNPLQVLTQHFSSNKFVCRVRTFVDIVIYAS